VPALASLVFILTELASSSFYKLGGTPLAIGLTEAALFAWLLAVTAPVG
jgi:hypothetical protein